LCWQGLDHGDQVALALGLDLKHAEAGFFVEERDALNQRWTGFRWM
jgi:hypothetical protein